VTAPDSTVATNEDAILHGTLPTANVGSDDPATQCGDVGLVMLKEWEPR
jgi:hypothetical protein